MRICGYCGKANEDTRQFCAGCGTALEAPREDRAESQPTPLSKSRPRMLNAGSATIILLAYLVSSILFEFLLPTNPSNISVGLVLDSLVGGFIMILVSSVLVPTHLKDISRTGAAWVLGRWEAIAKGLIIGLIIGMGDEILVMSVKYHAVYKGLKPIVQASLTPGFPQILWVLAAVLIAPPIEEMLFRGVLYGGFCKSFGPMWATTFTTFVFVAIHYPYYIYAPTNLIGIIIAALAALWCRLRWNAIGPAAATHFGYNSVLAVFVIYWTWR